jgi:hypothetical protein
MSKKYETLLKNIKSILGSPFTEYEDARIFVDFQILKLKNPLKEQVLDWFVDLMANANTYGREIEEGVQYSLLEEWALILIGDTQYAKALPILIQRFGEYAEKGWNSGWGIRNAFYSAMMKMNTQEATNFLAREVENESVEYLRDNLQNFIQKFNRK